MAAVIADEQKAAGLKGLRGQSADFPTSRPEVVFSGMIGAYSVQVVDGLLPLVWMQSGQDVDDGDQIDGAGSDTFRQGERRSRW